ncbi:MAG: MBL-fold metallo-hydrolase superfamily [uncultured Cytophagales bacterium]|uniref:MBL-fold metallo-hydrolase superfamily n=1 Tax=uncultured Cytophagales bacterium TaxID=158755 RepID=A0A6J4KRZ1_9SPHI|nr:MAG: MBL-fold metallo-hydrolase superfamily [uncultured Cytophagales bacterium]
MVHIKSFTFNAFSENTYVLYDDTRQGVLIDPGCYDRQERETLAAFISGEKLEIKHLLNTHGHVDHVLGNAWAKRTYGVQLRVHPLDEQTLRSVQVYAPMYGMAAYEPTEPDGFLEEGDQVTFGDTTLEVLFVPGHAPGHIAFYHAGQAFCIGGDVLFQGSIGRYDLPGGNQQTLLRSIREKLLPLGDAVTVYPGHGPATTIGREKKYNPFLQS